MSMIVSICHCEEAVGQRNNDMIITKAPLWKERRHQYYFCQPSSTRPCVCRSWHLALQGCRGFAGPVPPPLWMSTVYEIVPEVYHGGLELSNRRVSIDWRTKKETGPPGPL